MMRSLLLTGLLTLCTSISCAGQTLRTGVEGSGGFWPRPRMDYRHDATLSGRAALQISRFSVQVRGSFKAWGGAHTRFDNRQPYPLEAEWPKTLAHRRSAALLVRLGGLAMGPAVWRRQVNHIWIHDNIERRHDYFPVKGGWREGERRCENPPEEDSAPWTKGSCPGVGYTESAGLRATWQSSNVMTSATVIPIRYKDLTLTPTVAVGRLEASLTPRWSVRGRWSVDIHQSLFGRLEIRRFLWKGLYLSVRGGRLDAPDWTREFWTVSIRLGLAGQWAMDL